jgi:putative peptidoglycan binding protein
VQSSSPRVVSTRTAPAKPVATARTAPNVVQRPNGAIPQRFNPNLPRMTAQSPIHLQRAYSPPVQTSNPAIASINAQRNAPMQQPVTMNPAIRQTGLRTVAEMRQRRGFVTREGNILDPATRQNEIHTVAAMRQHQAPGPGPQVETPDAAVRNTELRTVEMMRERRAFQTNNQTLATVNQQPHLKNRNPEAGPQSAKPDRAKNGHGKKWHNKRDHVGFDEASRRHWHEWHDRNWWHDHCQTIVFVNTGFYFLDGSYWYPAYGYDPLATYYDYDGPVYTYSNLLPDEVIANVQTALQDAGYYYGPITGSLSVDTRAAIANFQRDYGLQISGAIDEPTVEALGLDRADDTYQTDQGY